MPTERVLITVTTYPTLSGKYTELVCSAGLRSDGSWIRLYPIPLRQIDEMKKFHKWEWIEVLVDKNTADRRPESYRPDTDSIRLTGEQIDSKHWDLRVQWIEKNGIYTDINVLINKNKESGVSLATFKPNDMVDFIWEKSTPYWDANKLAAVEARLAEGDLFNPITNFKIAKKVPYTFKYIF